MIRIPHAFRQVVGKRLFNVLANNVVVIKRQLRWWLVQLTHFKLVESAPVLRIKLIKGGAAMARSWLASLSEAHPRSISAEAHHNGTEQAAFHATLRIMLSSVLTCLSILVA